MTRNQRVQMVRFPNRERIERRMMLYSLVVFGSILTLDLFLSSIGW